MEANFTERIAFTAQMMEVVEVEKVVEVSTDDHTKLKNRDAPDQHPISSITGLQEALDKAGGAADPDEVAKLVEEYLAANPPAGSEPGKDGVSPTVSVEIVDGGYEITITDVKGSRSFVLKNGTDGTDGKTPEKGVDYFTPEEVDEIAAKAAEKVTIDQVTPEQVVFPDGLKTTYEVGKVKLTNGIAELVPPGGTLADYFDAFMDEKNPATTQPSVTITFSQAKGYEVGTNVTPSYGATLNPGSYTFGPTPTGVTATAWAVTDTDGNSSDSASGSFPELTVEDNTSYKITAKATHTAGEIPQTNTEKDYPEGQIEAGTKSATSGSITGYRRSFFGTVTEKGEITSEIIRELAGSSSQALANGSTFDVPVPIGAVGVVIAYPATLRDILSIKDENGMNAEISSGFTPLTVQVEGANGYAAIPYKVYVMYFAQANDTANVFAATI